MNDRMAAENSAAIFSTLDAAVSDIEMSSESAQTGKPKERRWGRRLLLFLLLLVAVSAVWLYWQRLTPVNLATYIPESAIGYLDINNLPEVVNRYTSTNAWQRLAPVYGIKQSYAGKIFQLVRLTGLGTSEMLLLSRAQCAIVVTSLEVLGEEVKPRWAIIAETHSSPARLRGVIENRLPAIANQLFSEAQPEASTYAGVPIKIYRDRGGEKRIFSAQIESEWVLANHPEAMEACIDARLGRAANLAANFDLQQTRPLIGGDVYGFVTAKGAARLTQFGAHVVGGRLLGESPLGEAFAGITTSFSSQVSQGIAYGMGFERGVVVDRYVWILPARMVDQLREAVRTTDGDSQLLTMAPAVREMTIVRVHDPGKTFESVSAVVSSRLGVAESFIFRKFTLGARDALFGLSPGETASEAFGDELASITLDNSADGRIWLFKVRDRGKMEALTSRFLTQRGAKVTREVRDEAQILVSSERRYGAAAFFTQYVALGSSEAINKLIDVRRSGANFIKTKEYQTTDSLSQRAPIISYSATLEDDQKLIEWLASRLSSAGGAGGTPHTNVPVEAWPLAVSNLMIIDRGLLMETHSSLGNLPFVISLFNGDPQESANDGRGREAR
jgi:hypothetical protein